MGLQEATGCQSFSGHFLQVTAFHIHSVGEVGHILVGELSAQLVENFLQVGGYIGKLLEDGIPYQQGTVVLGKKPRSSSRTFRPALRLSPSVA